MWRKENSTLFYCFTPSFNPADFHKYENYELKNKFYEDQINQRVMFVSKEIDEEYEEKRSSRIAQLQVAENSFQMEMSFIFDKNEEINSNQDNLQEVSESALNASVSRSSLIRQTKSINSMGSQADLGCRIDQPQVRKVKLCTEKVKTALAEVSVRAQISPEKACKAAQAFSKNFFGHNYYLSYKEKYSEQAPKMPKTAEDYPGYADISSDKKND